MPDKTQNGFLEPVKTTYLDWTSLLSSLTQKQSLSREQARDALTLVMEGEASGIKLAALLMGLATREATVPELVGLVEAMRAAAVKIEVDPNAIDTAGTGGDQAGTFNISTLAALVAAGAGAKVAKHGNRSASSKCGSADVLEELGLNLELPPEATAQMIDQIGFGFLFAPRYHPSMRYVATVRSELGFPTVFNFLGPLSNPAGVKRQVIGVYRPDLAETMVRVLDELGTAEALVYYGQDGLDEVSISRPTTYFHLRDGQVSQGELTPQEFGFGPGSTGDLAGGTPATNAQIIRSVLAGEPGPARQAAVMNAAPALVVAGLANDWEDAARCAEQAIDSGKAAEVLEQAVAFPSSLD